MRYFVSFFLILTSIVGVAQEFSHVKNQKDFLSKSINCVGADEYALWIGSDKGINRVELDKDSITEISARETSKPVLSICNDNKYLWVGIAQKGLYLFNKKKYVFVGKFKKQLGSKDITQLKKEGNQLFVRTKSKESFVINLSDTSIQEHDLNDGFDQRTVMIASFRGNKYKASKEGLLLLNTAVAVVGNETVQDTTITNEGNVQTVADKAVIQKITVEEEVNESAVNVDGGLCESKKGFSNYLWILILSVLAYSFILVKVVSFKYKKDIKILEEELLKTKK